MAWKSLKDLQKAARNPQILTVHSRTSVENPTVIKSAFSKLKNILLWPKNVWGLVPIEIVKHSINGFKYYFNDGLKYEVKVETETESHSLIISRSVDCSYDWFEILFTVHNIIIKETGLEKWLL